MTKRRYRDWFEILGLVSFLAVGQVIALCEYSTLLELWENTDSATDLERSDYYYQEYNQAKLRSIKLQRQYQFSFSELL